MPESIRLPYFDTLLALLDSGHPIVQTAFGDHVHWGYWPDPSAATRSPDDFRAAAERLTQMVYRAARVEDGERILDAGCGFGGTLASLDRSLRNAELIGLNIDSRQLRRAQTRSPVSTGNSFTWLQGDACRLPVADGSCNAVTAVECIFHFPSRADFFREARRVLKPGGRLALSDFVATAPLRPIAPLVRAWPAFYGRCDISCTLDEYRRIAATHGFEPTLEQDITRETLPTYDFLRWMTLKTGWRGVPGRKISAALETLAVEWTSRLGLVRYWILGWRKVG